MPKKVQFSDHLITWNLRSNTVARKVTFNWTKIGGKFQNWKIQMRHFWRFSNTVRSCTFSSRILLKYNGPHTSNVSQPSGGLIRDDLVIHIHPTSGDSFGPGKTSKNVLFWKFSIMKTYFCPRRILTKNTWQATAGERSRKAKFCQ